MAVVVAAAWVDWAAWATTTSAWGARRLCRRRTIAGGYGNPFRVPM
jgi:hypothetical protein